MLGDCTVYYVWEPSPRRWIGGGLIPCTLLAQAPKKTFIFPFELYFSWQGWQRSLFALVDKTPYTHRCQIFFLAAFGTLFVYLFIYFYGPPLKHLLELFDWIDWSNVKKIYGRIINGVDNSYRIYKSIVYAQELT